MTIGEVSKKYGLTQDTLRYYERAGMIPPVGRGPGGKRDYREEDLRWLELALCMRSAGLRVEVMAQYLRLFQQGEATMPDRLRLLSRQREALLERRSKIDESLARLNYKIERYEAAVRDGSPLWEE
ncbi:MAG: MerR family transcriptional regulator [Oscillospiraceae bacterium]|nr:MerR family transcriptional regulator [Oscillospiraceae bacterium]